ncbi:MAG: CehA/McbA family metallohydrolase [Victivallales bacterium]|nr:CehA/McbA family metallohydrolase [Victivallales bacterium]
MSMTVNYYGQQLKAYRASLHTHSTISDGQFTPAEVIKLYADEGYDILAFTDHSLPNPVSTYDSRGMTLISGMEMHPMGPRGENWHLLALGLPEDFPPPDADKNSTAQSCIDAARAAGGLVFCAHPSFCGFRSTDIMPLRGLEGIEVFNSGTRFAGKGFNMQCWDELLDEGHWMRAIAVDDMHGRRDLFCGWTMILTDEPLSQAAVRRAIRSGNFYATQGPQLLSISLHDNVLEAEFTPCTEVIGVSWKWRGYSAVCDNFTGPGDGQREITSCRLKLKNDIKECWIRLQLKDSHGRYAWCNPVRFNPANSANENKG